MPGAVPDARRPGFERPPAPCGPWAPRRRGKRIHDAGLLGGDALQRMPCYLKMVVGDIGHHFDPLAPEHWWHPGVHRCRPRSPHRPPSWPDTRRTRPWLEIGGGSARHPSQSRKTFTPLQAFTQSCSVTGSPFDGRPFAEMIEVGGWYTVRPSHRLTVKAPRSCHPADGGFAVGSDDMIRANGASRPLQNVKAPRDRHQADGFIRAIAAAGARGVQFLKNATHMAVARKGARLRGRIARGNPVRA